MDAGRPDAIVCANDWTAARLMRTLLELRRRVPGDVRLAGIDDMEYASLLPVPLTTLRQPTREIGAAALAAMLDRVSGSDAAHARHPVARHAGGAPLVRRRRAGPASAAVTTVSSPAA